MTIRAELQPLLIRRYNVHVVARFRCINRRGLDATGPHAIADATRYTARNSSLNTTVNSASNPAINR